MKGKLIRTKLIILGPSNMRRMVKHLNAIATGLAAWFGTLQAGTIHIPNGSFESPVTTFVDVNIDNWQKGAKPGWFNESGGFLWSQETGTFKNTPPASSDHLDNCDGGQAIWMFAVPEVELFQDYDSVAWNDPAPSNAFDARFEVGKSYDLTVGINGGGGGMSNGATMRITLYYRDTASNRVAVGTTTITNSPVIFPTHTHLTDFHVRVPMVGSGDACAGRNIGVQLLSTVTTNLQGGYWDLDNVRLSSVREPRVTGARRNNDQFKFFLESEPGIFEILATTNVHLPVPDWTRLGTLTNFTGIAPFTDALNPFTRRFYRARQLP